ncbi:AMP-binding domain protein [Variovorax sp. PBL-H6]|nr:AMP-binding domain protein [Variovorax sp. PBL-H6]
MLSEIQFNTPRLGGATNGRLWPHAVELPVAYVQLRPGVHATEDELLSFAREQITERAAMPKAIRLVATMPLTGVGKIFHGGRQRGRRHRA